MDPARFDQISRLFARRRLSRRSALQGLGAGALTTALAGSVELTRVSHAAPAPTASPVASPGPTVVKDTTFTFVQTFEAGTLVPKLGSPDTFTLVLDHGLGQTIYVSDRPARVFGALPTARFLAPRHNLGFTPRNPPNAALVMEVSPGDEDVLVVELTGAAYDDSTHTATYDARVLSDYQKLGVSFQETPQSAQSVQHQFGAASLFIDDCPDASVSCYRNSDGVQVGSFGPMGHCYQWCCGCCQPCGNGSQSYWTTQCNQQVAACNNDCTASDIDQTFYCWGCPPACAS